MKHKTSGPVIGLDFKTMRKTSNNTKASLAFDAINTLFDNAEIVNGEITRASVRWNTEKYPNGETRIHCSADATVLQHIHAEASEKREEQYATTSSDKF